MLSTNYPYSWNCYTRNIDKIHLDAISVRTVATSPSDCPQSCSVHTSCTTCLASYGLFSVAHARLRKLSTFRHATEERAQKFDPDDASLPRSGQYFWLDVPQGNLLQPIRSATQIWVLKCHEISPFVLETSSISWANSGGFTRSAGFFLRLWLWVKSCLIFNQHNSKLIRQVAIVTRKTKHICN